MLCRLEVSCDAANKRGDPIRLYAFISLAVVPLLDWQKAPRLNGGRRFLLPPYNVSMIIVLILLWLTIPHKAQLYKLHKHRSACTLLLLRCVKTLSRKQAHSVDRGLVGRGKLIDRVGG